MSETISGTISATGPGTASQAAHGTKVALVTGASSGIGADTARLLHEHGFIVYAVARRLEPMHPLGELGVRVFGMDVTDDASVTAGVQKIIAETGRIDVLVNNAGYGSYGSVEEVPLAEARRQFEVNVFAAARLIQLVVPQMRARGSGRIINISSIGGKIYEPLGGWYHATKFAVEGLSDSLRIELRPFGIDVVLVEPGPILTEWNAIARENMAKNSAGGPYAGQAASMARVFEGVDASGRSSQPVVVARKILKAATTPRPSARYPVGRGAGTIVRARKLLPDRAFDMIITRMFG
jgi:NAD(P)-dependent dehydrogenase (short-subunit alcohol dehydrogenase family)